MSLSLQVADCPECRGVRTAILGTIGLCFACFTEFVVDDDDLQPWRESASPLSILASAPPSRELPPWLSC